MEISKKKYQEMLKLVSVLTALELCVPDIRTIINTMQDEVWETRRRAAEDELQQVENLSLIIAEKLGVSEQVATLRTLTEASVRAEKSMQSCLTNESSDPKKLH